MKNLNTYNLYPITSANNITISISSKRLYKNNFENTVYKNYNNSQISRCKYYMSSKVWDIVWVSKFKTRSKIMTLLIKKWDENCIERAQLNERLTELKKNYFCNDT